MAGSRRTAASGLPPAAELETAATQQYSQLLTLRFSRQDEIDADLAGLELAARAGFNPDAAISLCEKMVRASGANGGPGFLSTDPSGPDRIQRPRENVPRRER